MKKLLVISFCLLWMAGCSPKPEIVDNDLPGSIRVLVFQDENRNEVKDSEEIGVVDEVAVGQDISCPAQNIEKMTVLQTGANGEVVFEDLDPGVYCVMYMGTESLTTKITVEVHLSSEQEVRVGFGLAE